MFKIGIVENFHKDGIKLLENHPNFEYEIIDDVSKENLIKELPKFDGLTLRVAKLGSDVLSKCKKLKVISRHGVGYDNVDINHLKKNNINTHVVSRGYGGKFKETVFVNRRRHNASDVGDEPLLISRHAKVWVSKKKKEGVLAAYKAGAELVLLDDGYQNFSITKDVNILVFDAEINLKNENIFPLGNLRERPRPAIDRADFLISIGNSVSNKNLRETIFQNYDQKIIDGKFVPNIIPKLKKRKR